MKQLFNLINMQYGYVFAVKKYMMCVLTASILMIVLNKNYIITGSALIIMGLTYTIEAYEEKSKTVNLIYTLPVNPKIYVLSKYVYGYLNTIVSIIIVCIINYIANLFNYDILGELNILNLAISLSYIGIFITIVVIPLSLIFGFNKIRIILLFLIIFSVGVVQLLLKDIPNKCVMLNGYFGKEIMALIFIVVFSIVSYCITAYLYSKKDK